MSDSNSREEMVPVRMLADGKIRIYANQAMDYQIWVKRGNALVDRNALDEDDPDQVFNFLSKHGIDPNIYGIVDPKKAIIAKYDKFSRRDLIFKVIELEKQLDQTMRHG